MNNEDKNRGENGTRNDSTEPSTQPESRQEQSDPQLTELKGFVDSSEDLEPTLTDGTTAVDKAPPYNVND
jgi:hypothetical protein